MIVRIAYADNMDSEALFKAFAKTDAAVLTTLVTRAIIVRPRPRGMLLARP